MVKRILTDAGYTYTLQEFIDNDVEKTPSLTAQIYSKSVSPLTFVPLSPPVYIKK